MARSKGSANLSASLEVLAGAPLDARDIVQTKADLTAQDSFPYKYIGMEVYVVAENKKYRLLGNDPTNIENWQEVGAGGGGTSDYADLSNKPSIENVTLSGNKSASDLGLAKITDLADFITKTVDDLVNYYKKTETYTKGEVDAIVTAIKNSRFEVVATLPTSDIKTNVIYLVPSTSSKTKNVKDEYINLDGTSAGWEQIGSTSVDLSDYVTKTELNTALADYTTTTDLTALLAGKQDKMQYSTLPTPSAELEGKIVEYTGATFSWLVHGYFYECVSDGEDTPSYSWQQTNVQPNSGGGSSYTAGDGIDITNDVISTKQSEEGDIDEIIDVYPTAGNLVSIVNAFNKGDIYSTEERMIGQYIDGKPLYQKVIEGTLDSASGATTTISVSSLNVDKCVFCDGMITKGTTTLFTPYLNDTLYYVCVCYFDDSNHAVKIVSKNMESCPYKIILKYTKTTDTAISIGEATEYSTDEKVVGTWIDGRPIYQRTYEQEIALAPDTWVASSLVATNVDKVINGIGYNAGSSIDCLLGGIVNGYFGFNSTRSQSITINAFTVQYLKTTT